jgi:hypothetical protein
MVNMLPIRVISATIVIAKVTSAGFTEPVRKASMKNGTDSSAQKSPSSSVSVVATK